MADVNNNNNNSKMSGAKKTIRRKINGMKDVFSIKRWGSREWIFKGSNNSIESTDSGSKESLRTVSVPAGLEKSGLIMEQNEPGHDPWKTQNRIKARRRQSSVDHKELERLASKYRKPKLTSIASIDENSTLKTKSRPNTLRLMSQQGQSFDRPRSLILDTESNEFGGLEKSLLDILNSFEPAKEHFPDQVSISSFNSIPESSVCNEFSDLESCASSVYEHDIGFLDNNKSEETTPVNFESGVALRRKVEDTVYKNRSFNRDKKSSVRRSTSYIEDDSNTNGILQVLQEDSIRNIIKSEAEKIISDKDYDALSNRKWSKDLCSSVRDQIRVFTGPRYKIVVNAFVGSIKWGNTDSLHVSIANKLDPARDFFVVGVFENSEIFISVSVLVSKR